MANENNSEEVKSELLRVQLEREKIQLENERMRQEVIRKSRGVFSWLLHFPVLVIKLFWQILRGIYTFISKKFYLIIAGLILLIASVAFVSYLKSEHQARRSNLDGSAAGNGGSDIKVFGYEFCKPYSIGECINQDVINAVTESGNYKYPKGQKASDECIGKIGPTDSGIAYCSMVFHREEQSPSRRAQMCLLSERESYRRITNDSAMETYDYVWGCK